MILVKIIVGSSNQTKLGAVTANFPEADITPISVSSDVSSQPIGDEETMQGAINRAKNAQRLYADAFAIGLEGGVMFLHHQLYLNNWGAIITPDKTIYTAAGARIPLPSSFIRKIEAGLELSDVMNEYAQRKNIRHHEGAIGIFTNNHISRTEMFTHIVSLLKGQMEYQMTKE